MNIERSGYLDHVQEHVFSCLIEDGLCHLSKIHYFNGKGNVPILMTELFGILMGCF